MTEIMQISDLEKFARSDENCPDVICPECGGKCKNIDIIYPSRDLNDWHPYVEYKFVCTNSMCKKVCFNVRLDGYHMVMEPVNCIMKVNGHQEEYKVPFSKVRKNKILIVNDHSDPILNGINEVDKCEKWAHKNSCRADRECDWTNGQSFRSMIWERIEKECWDMENAYWNHARKMCKYYFPIHDGSGSCLLLSRVMNEHHGLNAEHPMLEHNEVDKYDVCSRGRGPRGKFCLLYEGLNEWKETLIKN